MNKIPEGNTGVPPPGIPQDTQVKQALPLEQKAAITDQVVLDAQSKREEKLLKYLGNLKAHNPVLPKGNATGQVSKAEMTASDWLKPSPLTTFMGVMLGLIEAMKDEKKQESEIFQEFVVVTLEMADDIAQSIRDSAKKQAAMHITNAVASTIQAGVSAAQYGYLGLKGSSILKSGADPMIIQSKLGHISATSSAAGGIANNLVNAGKEIATAVMTTQKGEIDARTEELRSLKQIIDSLLNEALQAEKEAGSNIKELIQVFRQMVKEHMQAHGFR